MWPSSISAEKPANMPVTSLAANHVHFNVQNPTAHSTAWSREASLNTIPAIDGTILCILVAPLADNRTFSEATERSIVTTRYLMIVID